MWATASDCGPQTVDGQCGMSSFFGTFCGFGGAAMLVVIARAVGVSPDGPFRSPRRISSASLIAMSGGLVAVEAYIVADAVITGSQPAREIVPFVMQTFLLTAFFGAPFAFTIVMLALVASYRRIRRLGRVTAPWTCGVGGGAGLFLGLVTPRAMAFGFRDRPWMVSAGLLLGIAIGWVLWLAGFRHRPPTIAPVICVPARDAI